MVAELLVVQDITTLRTCSTRKFDFVVLVARIYTIVTRSAPQSEGCIAHRLYLTANGILPHIDGFGSMQTVAVIS